MGTITLAEGGTAERKIEIKNITVPDLWHIAMRLHGRDQEMVLECWHLAHDMKRHIQSQD